MADILDKKYVVTMPDGSRWAVPVRDIALDCAGYWAKHHGGDTEKALREEVIPLFENNHDEIANWARNDMDWTDVEHLAVRIDDPDITETYQEGWVNGEWEIVDGTEEESKKD